MGSAIFVENGIVAIFYVLPVMLFTSLFSGVSDMSEYQRDRKWYDSIARHIRGMPAPIAFPIAWTLLYILTWIAMFLFYRNLSYATSPTYLVDAVTIIFVLNIMANKLWSYCFFVAKQTVVALLLCLWLIISGFVIVGLFGANARWAEFGLFIWYPLWCLYALYLNAAWIYVEQNVVTAEPAPPVYTMPPSSVNPANPATVLYAGNNASNNSNFQASLRHRTLTQTNAFARR